MTLIIGAKSKDGISIFSDTRLINSEGRKSTGQKVFQIIDNSSASIMVGVAGTTIYANEIVSDLTKEFEKSLKRAPISEDRFIQILEDCIEKQINYNLDWQERTKNYSDNSDITSFECIIGGKINNNNKNEFILYHYSNKLRPSSANIKFAGIATEDAAKYDFLIKNIIKTDFQYKNLPSKLVNQILFLIIRIVAKARWDVDEPIYAHIITKDGYDVVDRKKFFPIAANSRNPFQYGLELLDTASKYFGKDKVPSIDEFSKIIKSFSDKIKHN